MKRDKRIDSFAETVSQDEADAYLQIALSSLPATQGPHPGIDALHPNLSIFNFGTAAYVYLWLTMANRFNTNNPLPWVVTEDLPRPEFVLATLSTNVLNSICGVREMCQLGFDGQARILFRYFVEITDLMLAVTASDEFYRLYTS